MNLELIKEITVLKSEGLSYTQIADTTGIAKSTIVLSLRLNDIFESHYSLQLSSLQSELGLLKSSVDSDESIIADKESEINRLTALVTADAENDMVVDKKRFIQLKDELLLYKNKADSLERRLERKENYLNDLSLIGKMRYLFQ